MTNTVFTEEQTDQVESSNQDSNAFSGAGEQSAIDQLVGEGKKYSDVEALASSRVAADEHIKKLEEENAKLREQATAGAAREDILKELQSLTSANSATQAHPETVADAGAQHSASASSEDDVSLLVEQTLAKREAENRALENELHTSRVLTERYGENVGKELELKAASLGVSVEDLQRDAQKSPAKVLALFGITPEAPAPKAAPVGVDSSLNTDTPEFQSGGAVKAGSKAYFDQIRRTNPNEYWKPETQKAILKAHEDGLYV